MASTLLVAVRSALVEAVAALDAFQGVEVMYAYKPVEAREFAHTENARFTHAPAAMKSGRNFRNEQGRFDFVIVVQAVGLSQEDAANRALDLGLAFEEFVADHKSGYAGTSWIQVAGDGSLTEIANDRASLAEVVYPVSYNARLT